MMMEEAKMITVQAEQLCKENFEIFGQYHNMCSDDGPCFGDQNFTFYRDSIRMVPPVSALAFSTLLVERSVHFMVPALEYHDHTAEIMMPMDDDTVLCLAPAGNTERPDTEALRAFLIPRGTMIHINPGTWHYMPQPLFKKEVHVLIVLPERTYHNDLTAVNFEGDNLLTVKTGGDHESVCL